ncbi:MAG: TlpA disulfide reductase family protein [Bacteriovoracaceae bacterium]|jgi:thiol-disulfide isomerase/thioredoxin|nr:TlpA disulfide reductase family protein [Bacteriovoracaceae bacterium]
MKRFFSLSNILFLSLLVFVLYKNIPVIKNNFNKTGHLLKVHKAKVYSPESENYLNFPPDRKSLVIFWMSTCGPCKLEMARLKSSVNDGKINKNAIFAINPFETEKEIRKFIKKNDFPFIFISDPNLSKDLNITATPTILFLDKNIVKNMKTGISFTGIWSAENFLND